MNDEMQSHMRAMRSMHERMLWTQLAIIALGAWLVSAPAVLGYFENFGPEVARVTAERGLAPPETRALWLAWSDMASGAALIVFGAWALLWRYRMAQWGSCLIGIWLLFAPLIFWAPGAAAYANDTLCGALAIAFAILVPMMPGMSHEAMMQKEDIPPGWDYSPSSWSQRLPIIALALFAFFIARYLAAYQMGHISSAWDPFFDDGTERIITSDVSRAWPVADAGLGATSYLLEALSGMMGDRRRWRTMPWMVAMFGVLVVPLGAVSIGFIVIQPILIGTWCTLCLASAAAMVLMLPYTFDELVAMGQFLVRAKREGKPLWSTFWQGGEMPGARLDRSPPLSVERRRLEDLARQARALPKALIAASLLGIVLMFTRWLFGASGAMADSDHLVGSLVFVVSICALSEVVRPMRLLNALFGAWLLAAPWLLEGATAPGAVASLAIGALLIALAFPRGPVVRHYAGWDRWLAW